MALVQFSIVGGRMTHPLFEQSAEMLRVLKSHFICNLRNGLTIPMTL